MTSKHEIACPIRWRVWDANNADLDIFASHAGASQFADSLVGDIRIIRELVQPLSLACGLALNVEDLILGTGADE